MSIRPNRPEPWSGYMNVRMTGIPGAPPNLASPPEGCRFNPRCPHCDPAADRELFDLQTSVRPLLREVEAGHTVACHLVEREL